MVLKKIIFIVGPTAVGKTGAAVLLAQKIKGEIVSCDSMQVYREISIASNKPAPDVMKKVRHYLIGIVSVKKTFDVAAFRKKALAAINSIHKRGKIPIVVGGSGLYVNVLLDGIFAQGADLKVREQLQKEAEGSGPAVLHQRLSQVDPAAASKIHPNDTRRIIRALEVGIAAAQPISQLQKKRTGLWGKFDIKIFALNRDRAKLYEIINERVDKMFEQGLIDEMRVLSRKRPARTAEAIIGLNEVLGFLKGEQDLTQAKELMKMNTRRYAKRQLTWFRKDKRLTWMNMDHLNVRQIAAKIGKEI